MRKAVVLFSGGLDSTTVLAYAQKQGFDCYPISFDYGQRHQTELAAAQRIAQASQCHTHKIVQLPPQLFGPSALTDASIQVPAAKPGASEIPVTYVPARNIIFLALSLGYAETIGAQDIFIGVSDVDYSGYPDCRPEFIQAFEVMANLGTKQGASGQKIKINAPLIGLSKAGTIKLGLSLGVDYAQTVSCYQADPATGRACGQCDSCNLRKLGFANAGVADPTRY